MENNKSNFVGNIGDKIETVALFSRCFTIERRGFPSWKTVLIDICEFIDENGNVFVWFTSAIFESRRGDTVKIRGTIKAHDEYKGQKQTVLTRCKVETLVVGNQPQKKNEEIIDTSNADVVRMPYKAYKEHYADCKTLKNTYNETDHSIEVVVPFGRMKKSGVRGKHFKGYEITFSDKITNDVLSAVYRAVDAEHAIEHCKREHKNAINIKVDKVYFY